MSGQRFLTGFGLLSISLVAHGAVFFSVDHSLSFNQAHAVREQQRIRREKEGPLQFEFVETPRAISSKKPARAKKISDRDALNQDRLKDKIQTAGRPHTQLQGYARSEEHTSELQSQFHLVCRL